MVEQESVIRLATFVSALVFIAAWELFAPLRVPAPGRAIRWSNNLALAILNMALARILFPLTAVYAAILANEHGLGLFNLFPAAPLVAVVVSLLAFDLSVYLVHRVFHSAPILWRMHRVHHADLDVDVATALRFHPIQMLLSVLLKLSAILAMGHAGSGSGPIRDGLSRRPAIQPRERAHPSPHRSSAALDHRHSGYAPRAPFHLQSRNRQQLRLRAAVVGSPLRHLPCRTRRGP